MGHRVVKTELLTGLCPIHPGFIGMSGIAPPSRPLRFNLNRSAMAADVVLEAAPGVVVRTFDEAALHRIPMDIPDDFQTSVFAADVGVVVARLPELFTVAFELTGYGLLEGLKELVEKDRRWLVDE